MHGGATSNQFSFKKRTEFCKKKNQILWFLVHSLAKSQLKNGKILKKAF